MPKADATIKPGGEALKKALEGLANQALPVAEKALKEGGAVMERAVQSSLKEAIADRQSLSKKPKAGAVKLAKSTGDLIGHLGVAPARMNKSGKLIDVRIGFGGYNRHGVANTLVARAKQSGTERLLAQPFLTDAAKAAAPAANAAVKDQIIAEWSKIAALKGEN